MMYSSPPTITKKEKTRQALLQAACHIASQDGWAAVTVRHVAQAVGYAVPVVHDYFGSKQAMLAHIMDYGHQQLLHRLRAAASQHTAPAERLRAMAQAYLRFVQESPAVYQLMHGMEGMYQTCAATDVVGAELCNFVASELAAYNPAAITKQNATARVFEVWAALHGFASLSLHGAPLAAADEAYNLLVNDLLFALSSQGGGTAHV